MKKFSNPKIEIKRFNRESVITLSGEAKKTNAEYVSDELDTAIAGRSATKSTYNLSWD